MTSTTLLDRRCLVDTVLTQHAGIRQEYGKLDCCLLAARVVHAITGVDHSRAFDYVDKAGAQAIIDAHGGLTELFTATLGDPSDTLEYGDPCLMRWAGGESIGIYCDDVVYTMAENMTLCWFNSRVAKHGWHVG